MPDTNVKNLDNAKQNEMHKKHSFFGGEINEKTKDLLDFRYNTQEEIDKLNDEMTTTSDLDEIIKQANNPGDDEKIDNENEENLKEKDEKEAESNLEKDLQSVDESLDNDTTNNNYDEIYEEMSEPIEGEIVENPDENKNENDADDENNEGTDEDIVKEKNEGGDQETENNTEDNEGLEEENNNEENNKKEEENPEGDSVKFFDPFELNLDEDDEEIQERNDESFDPFGLNEDNIHNESDKVKDGHNKEPQNEKSEDNEENHEYNDEVEENGENDEEEVNEEGNDNEEIKDDDKEIDEKETNDNDIYKEDNEENKIEEKNEEQDDEEIETDEDTNEEDEKENEEVNEEVNDNEEDSNNGDINNKKMVINTPIHVNINEKEESIKKKKIKKNSTTGEIITNNEIQLEQGQDMPDSEDNEEYQPSAEELFEQEPEFFADDEISQQFMHLVLNVRGIFKLERKDGEQNPYFKILGGKSEDSTLEYLFYLIEEEDAPIDLYIKKVESNQENGEENEHLVQFSYHQNKELNIFVDEIILYEKINKSSSDSAEYNDTKAILEKFIFLTDNYYNKLKSELDKLHEEKKKKRQLQQIFKGF